MTLRNICLGFVAALLAPLAGFAQPLFDNPFQDAGQYRRERGATPPATLRLRYQTTVEDAGSPKVGEFLLEVASDWALIRQDGRETLFDFKLNRNFVLSDGTFTTVNGMALLATRVMERQNRTGIQRMLADAKIAIGDACDSDAELGLAVGPTLTPTAAERGDTVSLTCSGRPVGSLTLGRGAPPPAAFWPSTDALMPVHPELARRARASGRPPAAIETRFRNAGPAIHTRSWKLISAETVEVAYPLTEGRRNVTATLLDAKLGAGVGALAATAVSGTALGSPPTPDAWGRTLRAMYEKDGATAVAMALLPTANMFPDALQRCEAGMNSVFCQSFALGRAAIATEAAPRALFTIAQAEQAGNKDAAIEAMKAVATTPYKDHPALNASYALALMKFDKAAIKKARAAGLPGDPNALQISALRAYPYNAAYWLDAGDRYAAGYDLSTATLLYDVAFSLPMPEAVSDRGPGRGKRTFFERIRKDFPSASLQSTP